MTQRLIGHLPTSMWIAAVLVATVQPCAPAVMAESQQWNPAARQADTASKYGDAAAKQRVPAGKQGDQGDPAGKDEELARLREEIATLRRMVEQLQQKVAQMQAGAPRQASQPPAPQPLAGAPGAETPAGAPAAKTPEQIDLEKKLAQELGLGTGQPSAPAGSPPVQPTPQQPWAPGQPITIVSGGGGRNFLNLSLDALAAGGASTTQDISRVESGGHDPIQRGFTIQNLETVLEGAVDPYFRGQANIVLQINGRGETSIELEEAYLTSTSLPHNLQVRGGSFFTEFGRLNPTHPHTWDFVDLPLVNGRFLGPDGLRGPGFRLSWLLPTPFYSEAFITVENSQGETATSFRDVPGEKLFGRTLQDRAFHDAGDLLYVPHYAFSFDLSDTQTLLAGVSAAFGPNGAGQNTATHVYGVDLFWKWKPVNSMAGFPFLKWQTETMYRSYEAAAFSADTNGDGVEDLFLPAETFRDWGAYSQVLWGFRRGWVVGMRWEYLRGDRNPFDPDPTSRSRWRGSPNLTWYPTEFSKLRLQYNHDHLGGAGNEESLWLQVEFILGAHGAHKF